MKYSLHIHQRFYLLSLLFLFVFSSCAEKKEKSTLTVGALNGPSGLSILKLMQENDTSGTVPSEQYLIRNDPELIKAMMIREEIDIALLPFTMAALLYNNDLPYQLLGVPVWGSLYMVGKDSSVKALEQLRGKSIHLLPKNTTPDIVFRHLLAENGIDPSHDLLLDYTFPTPLELASALNAHRVDFGLLPEPMASQVLEKNRDIYRILDLTAMWYELYGSEVPLAQTAVMVHTSWAKEHEKELADWSEKYASAIQWTNTHTAKAALLAVQFGLARDARVVEQAIPGCRMDFRYGDDHKELLTNYLQLLYTMNNKVIGNRIPDDEFYYKK